MREIRNEEKAVKKSGMNRRGKRSFFFVTILLLCGGLVQATPVDVNIYSDTVIEDGDEYGTVNIYDTPPDQTTVTMTGGDISYCNLYDTTSLSFAGGDISLVTTYNSSSATVDVITTTGFNLYDNSIILPKIQTSI